MMILEGFSSPTQWSWIQQKDFEWVAKFKIGPIIYTVYIFREDSREDRWELSFVARTKTKDYGFRQTGTGNAFTVYGTVIDITINFLKQKSPKILWFGSDMTERNRHAVNTRLGKEITKRDNHYEMEIIDRDEEKYVWLKRVVPNKRQE